jgi:hypothetical protein
MINKYIKIILVGILIVLSNSVLKASQFNGVIHFQKIDGTDTTLFKYYVKDQFIRIEDLNANGDINGIMLINTEESTVILLSNSKKVFINVPISDKKPKKLNLEIEKTNDEINVAGMNCVLWIAKDKTTQNKYEFLVHQNGYFFFNSMLRILNREEPIANVWLTMDVKDDYFPYVGATYSSTGELISKIEIINIIEDDLPVEMFIRPEDYQEMETRQ